MDTLTLKLNALTHPTRRAILDRLAQGPASVGALAKPLTMSQQAVSKHLACLEEARLIEKRRIGRRHVCMLTPHPLQEVAEWIGSRAAWEESFDRLEDYLRTDEALNR